MSTTPDIVDLPDVDLADHDVPQWNVVVWNDPVNLMSYVVWVFRSLFGYPEAEATRLMLVVHNGGKAIVETAPRERAEMSAFRLHHHGLWATLERGR